MTIDPNELGKGMHRHIQEQDFQHGVAAERERIIKLLREKAKHLKQVSESIAMDDYMSDEDAAVPENGAFALNEFADALIKGEKMPFITAKQAEELTNEMLEE